MCEQPEGEKAVLIIKTSAAKKETSDNMKLKRLKKKKLNTIALMTKSLLTVCGLNEIDMIKRRRCELTSRQICVLTNANVNQCVQYGRELAPQEVNEKNI